ncbi:restriction endonuclease subunit S [Candidatus Nanobsidianus stetteri]|uniref:Restriction endonuclease subunit S n=1 Tax=Nanobsidianus stetteri TaxID=1294122 RepID=A0A2T9WL64_NANST|nr:restriction endonuclease subunit S [Candidatus Nanobsidianus stetteri]MCC5447136.1 restriction endonuclease subunit S [Candidatus Nanobsidianus stetteri]
MSEYNDEFIKFPKDWEVRKLKDVIIKAKSGGTPRTNVPEYWNGNIPFVKAQDITKSSKYLYNTEEFITEKGLENSNAWIVPENSLLLTIYGSIGFVAINKIPVTTNQAIVGIIPNKNIIDTEFLYYWYLYFKPYWSKFIKKSTQPNLTLEIVLNSSVPIPPLEEQKKIVEILNTVDTIIIDTTNLIEKLKILKEKTLNLLITGKIWHKEFKDTEIGKIPKNWEIVKLEEIAIDIYRYPTYYNIKYVGMNEGVPEVRAELIKENGELEDDLSKYRFISKETSKRFYRTILNEGDFVLSVRGTLGKVAIVPKFLEGANITANLMKISLNRLRCYPPFFKQFFLSDFFKKNLDNISSQTTIKTIQASKLKSIKIPLPPLEEQKKIAEILSTIDNKIETETKYLDYMKKLKEKLLAALMTGKIRVNSIAIGDLK